MPDSTFPVPLADSPVTRSYWVIEDRFLAGAYPGTADAAGSRKRVEELWNAGMRTFINLVEEDETNLTGQAFHLYEAVLAELGQQTGEVGTHLRFPVVDLSIPTVDRMRAILDAIDHSLAQEKPVYLHCFGGVGRTGTTVCCWLIRHGHATKDEVFTTLSKLRRTDAVAGKRPAPEREAQFQFVRDWSEP